MDPAAVHPQPVPLEELASAAVLADMQLTGQSSRPVGFRHSGLPGYSCLSSTDTEYRSEWFRYNAQGLASGEQPSAPSQLWLTLSSTASVWLSQAALQVTAVNQRDAKQLHLWVWDLAASTVRRIELQREPRHSRNDLLAVEPDHAPFAAVGLAELDDGRLAVLLRDKSVRLVELRESVLRNEEWAWDSMSNHPQPHELQEQEQQLWLDQVNISSRAAA